MFLSFNKARFYIFLLVVTLFLTRCKEEVKTERKINGEQAVFSVEVKTLIEDTVPLNPYNDSIKKNINYFTKKDQLLALGELSENWRKFSNIFAAEELLLAKKYQDKEAEADAMCKQSIAMIRRFRFDSANARLDSALIFSKINDLSSAEAQALSWKAEILRQQGELKKSIEMQKKAIEIANRNDDSKRLAFSYLSLGEAYRTSGEFNEAIKSYSNSIQQAKRSNETHRVIICLNGLGEVYRSQNNYPKALDYFNHALELARLNNNKIQIAFCLSCMGDIYSAQKDHEKALKLHQEAYDIALQADSKVQMCNSLSSIGMTYFILNEKEKALDFLQKTVDLATEIGNNNKLAFAHLTLGSTYESMQQQDKALEHYNKSLEISSAANDNISMVRCYNLLSAYQLSQKKYNDAFTNADKALSLAQELEIPEEIKRAAKTLSFIYEAKNDYKPSLKMLRLFQLMRDTIDNEENVRQLAAVEFQAKEQGLKAEQKAKEATFKAEQAQKEEELKTQKTIRYAFTIGFGLVLILVVVVYKNLRLNQRKNKIITEQKKEVEKQKELVEEKNKEITDSINYAKRLQEAILPPLKLMKQVFPKSFVLYLPKDIVAGDFYWMERNNDLVFFAAADSTGHGVPGAIVSVVCSNALNRAIKEFKLEAPGRILDKTRELVLETFEKSEGDVKDGMDVSLFCYNEKTKKVYWAGANNPLWYIVNGEFKEIKANKQPIGKTDNPLPFTTHEIEYAPGSVFYLLTDGFADQFGGPKGKKFKYKQLETSLLANHKNEMEDQRKGLEKTFNEWKAEREQVDDVTIIGIEL